VTGFIIVVDAANGLLELLIATLISPSGTRGIENEIYISPCFSEVLRYGNLKEMKRVTTLLRYLFACGFS
jgi:hypothetical protein